MKALKLKFVLKKFAEFQKPSLFLTKQHFVLKEVR